MAKVNPPAKSKAKPAEPTEVVIHYDLFDLPSAFHKAGLAGLVLLIESLKTRHNLQDEEAKYELKTTTITITFTEALLQKLMDDLYDAQTVEVAVKSRWQGAEVKRPPTPLEEEAGTKFIYEVVQPKGTFLRECYPDEEGLWLKLWRDMLWNIPRSRPTTREPYNQRAAQLLCKEGASAWADLLKVHKALCKNAFFTAPVSSALWPGVQALNAEGIPFAGRAEQNLLLHFWPLAVLLFVPQRVESDGSTDFAGFTLAIPEVTHLPDFLHDYPKLLAGLNEGLKPEQTARGYRPARAVIDLPAEGALVFLDHLAQLTGQIITSGALKYSIRSVEYVHLVKGGNNVKTLAAGRISPNPKLLAGYRSISTPRDEETRFRNPLFRRGLLLALLNGQLWYQPFNTMLATFDAYVFLRQTRKSPENGEPEKSPPQFAHDAAKRFRYETKLFTSSLQRLEDMAESPRPAAPLPVIVNRVVRNYLLQRTAEKTNTNLDKFRTAEDEMDWKSVPPEFNEAKQKLAQSLFLEFRSRKEQAFVDHFAATFFSVTQRVAEADRLELADVLIKPERRDDLKTLTLLALSANS